MNELDLTPIIGIGIEVAAALLVVLGGWAIAKLGKYLGLKQDAEIRDYLEQALTKGLAYGAAEAKKRTKGTKINVESETVAQAGTYVLAAVPDALTRFQITPERLADMLKARLNDGSS